MACFAGHRAEDVLHLRLSVHGPDFRLGEFFRLGEPGIASKDGSDEVLWHPALIVLLNKLRREIGAPIIVNSGYRSPAHNATIPGASPRSLHLRGMAADIRSPGASVSRLADVARRVGAGGIGRYSTFVHVDVGPPLNFTG